MVTCETSTPSAMDRVLGDTAYWVRRATIEAGRVTDDVSRLTATSVSDGLGRASLMGLRSHALEAERCSRNAGLTDVARLFSDVLQARTVIMNALLAGRRLTDDTLVEQMRRRAREADTALRASMAAYE